MKKRSTLALIPCLLAIGAFQLIAPSSQAEDCCKQEAKECCKKEAQDCCTKSGKTSQTKGYLGVIVENLKNLPSLQGAAQYAGAKVGVLVQKIEANSPASRSDLKSHDLITKVDGVEITNVQDFKNQIVGKKGKEEILLSVIRDGKTIQVPITQNGLSNQESKGVDPA